MNHKGCVVADQLHQKLICRSVALNKQMNINASVRVSNCGMYLNCTKLLLLVIMTTTTVLTFDDRFSRICADNSCQ